MAAGNRLHNQDLLAPGDLMNCAIVTLAPHHWCDTIPSCR